MAFTFIETTPENEASYGLFCIKNKKDPGFKHKVGWLNTERPQGLRLIQALDKDQKPAGFIELTPAERAWRPVSAPGYLFIHCIMVYPRKHKGLGLGRDLVDKAKEVAIANKFKGLVVLSSEGSWLTGRGLFQHNGFEKFGESGRFEGWVFKHDKQAPEPELIDWDARLEDYQGWHLLFAAQCPYHIKAATELKAEADDQGIRLNVKELKDPSEAQQVPCGFGTFALIRDGRLLADHYISRTRFKNILKAEL